VTDFILKTCVQLIAFLAKDMNEQDKSRLIQTVTGTLRFGVIGLTLAALIYAVRWW